MSLTKKRSPVPARTTDVLINVAWPLAVAVTTALFVVLQSIIPAREQTTPLLPGFQLAMAAVGFALTATTAWRGTGGGNSSKATTRRGSLAIETPFVAFGPKYRALCAVLALGFAGFSLLVVVKTFF